MSILLAYLVELGDMSGMLDRGELGKEIWAKIWLYYGHQQLLQEHGVRTPGSILPASLHRRQLWPRHQNPWARQPFTTRAPGFTRAAPPPEARKEAGLGCSPSDNGCGPGLEFTTGPWKMCVAPLSDRVTIQLGCKHIGTPTFAPSLLCSHPQKNSQC